MVENDIAQLKRFKVHRLGSLITIVLGFILLAYMVTVEDEPGAVPLAVILAGLGWYLVARRRMTAQRA